MIAFLEEKKVGRAEEVECTKVAVSFGAESSRWFGFGVAGDECVQVCFVLDAAGVGGESASDGAVRTEDKVAGANHAKELSKVFRRLGDDMANNPFLVRRKLFEELWER